MKNRALVCLFVAGILIAACIPAPGATAAEENPTQPVAASTSAPVTATSTPTTIPLPAAPGVDAPAVPAVPTVPIISLPLPGVGSAQASPNSGTLNCRTGPDVIWAVAAIVEPGQSVEITGKNVNASWWYVRHPQAAAGFCWVSAPYVNVSGSVGAVPFVATDPSAPTSGNFVGSIISVDMQVDPSVIDLPGCVGPAPTLNVFAKVKTNGPLKVKLYFEDQLKGNLNTHKLEFFRADIQDISSSFTPRVEEGTFWVLLHGEDINVEHLGTIARYTINCP
jgi:hypothetical protein